MDADSASARRSVATSNSSPMHFVFGRVGVWCSKLPLPLYADVRFRITMTHNGGAGLGPRCSCDIDVNYKPGDFNCGCKVGEQADSCTAVSYRHLSQLDRGCWLGAIFPSRNGSRNRCQKCHHSVSPLESAASYLIYADKLCAIPMTHNDDSN